MIKNYAEEFLDYSKKDVNCKYCYIDEAHYSPYFLKELSKSIIKDMKLE